MILTWKKDSACNIICKDDLTYYNQFWKNKQRFICSSARFKPLKHICNLKNLFHNIYMRFFLKQILFENVLTMKTVSSLAGFPLFSASIRFVFRKEIVKPWSDFRKASPVFALAKNASGKSAFSFGSFSLGMQRKWTNNNINFN